MYFWMDKERNSGRYELTSYTHTHGIFDESDISENWGRSSQMQ